MCVCEADDNVMMTVKRDKGDDDDDDEEEDEDRDLKNDGS